MGKWHFTCTVGDHLDTAIRAHPTQGAAFHLDQNDASPRELTARVRAVLRRSRGAVRTPDAMPEATLPGLDKRFHLDDERQRLSY
jgi:hypothetical protein